MKDGWKVKPVKAPRLCIYGLSRGRQTDEDNMAMVAHRHEMNINYIIHFANLVCVCLFIILTQVDLFCYIFAGTYGRSFSYEVSKNPCVDKPLFTNFVIGIKAAACSCSKILEYAERISETKSGWFKCSGSCEGSD